MGILKKLIHFWVPEQSNHDNIFAQTHRGRVRELNEDAVRISPERNLFIIADGMGGHNAGDVSSQKAVAEVDAYLNEERMAAIVGKNDEVRQALEDSIQTAHREIAAISEANLQFRGMGCTLVVAIIDGDNLHIAHVGDSRAYISNRKNEHITLITTDHSYVMELVKAGKMTMEEARNTTLKNELTQAVGASDSINPDYNCHLLTPGDTLLMCTDGLWDLIPDATIHQILQEPASVKRIVKKLIKAANNAGGKDNITAVVVRCPLQTQKEEQPDQA